MAASARQRIKHESVRAGHADRPGLRAEEEHVCRHRVGVLAVLQPRADAALEGHAGGLCFAVDRRRPVAGADARVVVQTVRTVELKRLKAKKN